VLVADGAPVEIGRDAAHGIVGRRLDGHGLFDRIHAQVRPAEIQNIGQLGFDILARDAAALAGFG